MVLGGIKKRYRQNSAHSASAHMRKGQNLNIRLYGGRSSLMRSVGMDIWAMGQGQQDYLI